MNNRRYSSKQKNKILQLVAQGQKDCLTWKTIHRLAKKIGYVGTVNSLSNFYLRARSDLHQRIHAPAVTAVGTDLTSEKRLKDLIQEINQKAEQRVLQEVIKLLQAKLTT